MSQSQQVDGKKGVWLQVTVRLTEGQQEAYNYIKGTSKARPDQIHQLIFDAGLHRVFGDTTQVHTRYLEDQAGLDAGEYGGHAVEIQPWPGFTG